MRLYEGKQYLYSITNYNLYIDRSVPEVVDEKGNFLVRPLFTQERTCLYSAMTPSFAEDEGLTLPVCEPWNDCKDLCPMLFARREEIPFEDEHSYHSNIKLTRLYLNSNPQMYKCKVLRSLLNCCKTDAEKKFAETYYRWAICGAKFSIQTKALEVSDLHTTYGEFLKSWQQKQLQFPEEKLLSDFRSVLFAIQRGFVAPALIPQVWLNYTYNPKRKPTQESNDIRDMPKRVDFFFMTHGKMHVVEIDDPSHYAIYDDSKRKYETSEERYTSNLRAERVLRKQGFEIHRLSNWEILNAKESELLQLIHDALDIHALYYRNKPMPVLDL